MKARDGLVLLLFILILGASAYALELPEGMKKLAEYQNELAISVTFLIAFIGGLLTFASPCGFVIVPTFFSYVFKERKRAMFMTAVFSLGMISAFVIFGIIAGVTANFFNEYKTFFAMISGVLLILFGIMMMLNKGFAIFDFRIKHKPNHSWSTFTLGFLFSTGWTPCVGPILGSIIVLSAGAGSIFKSALLFTVYALGVVLPLMIVSYFSDKHDISRFFTSKHVEIKLLGKKIRTHLYGIISGALLIAIGIIMFAYKGTSFFMEQIPQYLPWTMDFFTMMNNYLTESGVFRSKIANVAGIVIAGLIVYTIYKAITNHRKKYKQAAKRQ